MMHRINTRLQHKLWSYKCGLSEHITIMHVLTRNISLIASSNSEANASVLLETIEVFPRY